jgi:glycosyltransferase involved in cell wall biosynthesis
MNPLISIIIPAHNEEKYIGETLDALKNQSYRYFEVIVVANGCVDHTAAVAREKCDRLIDLPDRGLGKARNTGGAKARGDLLVFLDADTKLDPRALEVIAKQFRPTDSSATLRGQPDNSRFWYSLLYFYKNLLHRLALHCGSSGVICCWRDQFKEVAGFDEGLNLRENSELIGRLRAFGRYKFIGDAVAVTSMRRYDKVGAARGAWHWFRIWFRSLVSDLHHRPYEPIR